METIKINKETLEFEKIWYTNNVNGSDITGDGSKSNPYKTFTKSYNSCSSGDAIYLIGIEGANYNDYMGGINKNISIIGEGPLSKIDVSDSKWATYSTGNVNLYKVTLLGIQFFRDSSGHRNYYNCYIIARGGTLDNFASTIYPNFYNCILYEPSSGNGYYLAPAIFQDCLIYGKNDGISYSWGFYGGCSDYEVKTTYINYHFVSYLADCNVPKSNSNDTFVDEDYNIINPSINWQNSGTDTNPDGSQAHIGVYGGPFAWGEWSNFIPVPFTLHKNTSNVSSIYSIDADVTDRLSVQYEGVRLIPSMEIQIKSKITPRPDEEDVLIRSWSSTLVNTLDNFSLDRYSDSLYKVVSSGLSVGEITASLGGVTLLRVHEGGFSWTIPLPAPSGNETWELSGSSTPFIESEKTIRDFNIPEAGNYTRNEGSTYIAESALGMANEVELPTVVGGDYTYVAPFSSAGMSPWNLKEVTK